jgi:hypothetical protein
MNRARLVSGVLVPCALVLGTVAACSSSQEESTVTATPSPTAASPTTDASPTTAVSASTAAEPTTTSATSVAPAGGPGTCTGEMLSGQIVEGGGGAAGHTGVRIEFTNTSSQSCSMHGFPGVSFVGDNNGTQIGAPAQRESGAPEATVDLAPGRTAYAALLIANAQNYDAATCQPTPVDGFRVYPPNSTTALFVRDARWTGCAASTVELLSVQPVSAN